MRGWAKALGLGLVRVLGWVLAMEYWMDLRLCLHTWQLLLSYALVPMEGTAQAASASLPIC